MIRKYKKRPVVVEAVQFDGTAESAKSIRNWINRPCNSPAFLYQEAGNDHSLTGWCLVIKTLEGDVRAVKGDFVIKGVVGEFYPCKPDIFATTYEEV
jgi:hypothetical protein